MFELWKGMGPRANSLYSFELITAAVTIATLFCSYAHYWVVKEVILFVRKKAVIGSVMRVILFLLCLSIMIAATGFSDGYHGSTALAMLSRHFRFVSYFSCPFIAGLMAYNLFRKAKNQKDDGSAVLRYSYWLMAIVVILAALFVLIGTFPVPSRH